MPYAVHQKQGEPWMLPPGTDGRRSGRCSHFLSRSLVAETFRLKRRLIRYCDFIVGRGIVILLSDFLTLGDLTRPLNLLYSSGLEVWGLPDSDESEINPAMQGDLRLIDSETGETLDITNASELLSFYHDQRLYLQEQLDMLCRRRNGRFVSTSSATDLRERSV